MNKIIIVRPNGEMWEAEDVPRDWERQIIQSFLERLVNFEKAVETVPYFPESIEFPLYVSGSVAEEITAVQFKYKTRFYGWGYPSYRP